MSCRYEENKKNIINIIVGKSGRKLKEKQGGKEEEDEEDKGMGEKK